MPVLVGNWWTFVLRGLFAILFGLLCLFLPGIALLTLVFMFGIYALADGAFGIVAAFRRTLRAPQTPWWAMLLVGIVSLVAGLLAFFMPGLTAVALLYLIAAWAVVHGVFQIVAAVQLRRQITGEWLLALAGLLSILFGVLIALFPGAGALALLVWIGAYAIVAGVVLIVLGVRLRQWVRAADEAAPGFPPNVAPHP